MTSFDDALDDLIDAAERAGGVTSAAAMASTARAVSEAREYTEEMVKALAKECHWWLEEGRFLAGNAARKQAGVERTQAALAAFEEVPNG